MIRKPKKQVYDYYCLDCKSIRSRNPSPANNSARRCTECGSTNILREDHPLIRGQKNG